MERLLVNERLLPVVMNLQLHSQIGADSHTETQGELAIAEGTSRAIRRKGQDDLHVSVVAQLCSVERPLCDTRKAMCWTGLALRAWAEPRKDNRYSTADRHSRRKQALGTEKQDGPLPARRPTSDMSTL